MANAAPDTITIVATPDQYGGKPMRVKVAGEWKTATPKPIAVKIDPGSRRIKFYRLDDGTWTLTGRGKWVNGNLKQPHSCILSPAELRSASLARQAMPLLSTKARLHLAAKIGEALA